MVGAQTQLLRESGGHGGGVRGCGGDVSELQAGCGEAGCELMGEGGASREARGVGRGDWPRGPVEPSGSVLGVAETKERMIRVKKVCVARLRTHDITRQIRSLQAP